MKNMDHGAADAMARAKARAASKKQGGTTGAAEKLDKNRGSDSGGSNSPKKTNG